MVAFRATIMIVCMVVLPLAAVLGTALPKAVQTAIRSGDHEGPSAVEGDPPTKQDSAERAKAVADATHTQAAQEVLPRGHITSVRAVASEPSGAGMSSQPPAGDRTPQATASLWSRDSDSKATRRPPSAAPQPQRHPQSTRPNESPPPRRRDPSLRATAYSEPVESQPDESTPDAADDALSRGERRLRQLGTISYRLETWGVTGELYRFSCQAALSDQGQATKHFEATETSPARAIEAVVEQVESWRAARR
jgi:hypothetical protein